MSAATRTATPQTLVAPGEYRQLEALALELREILFNDASGMMQGAMVASPSECVAFAKWWIQRAKELPLDAEAVGAFASSPDAQEAGDNIATPTPGTERADTGLADSGGGQPRGESIPAPGETRRASSSAEPEHLWTLPAPPLFRLCTLSWRSEAWPDKGEGVWQILGYERMGTREEQFRLRRVMPAEPGGPTGETITVWRDLYERGGLQVWRQDVADPAYAMPQTRS